MTASNNPIKKLFHSTRRTIAAKWLGFQRVNQIALTGSQGKTNTTYVLSKILTSLGKGVRTDINLDTIYNVPITALRVRPWHKFVVWELGVDHPREMNKHLEIVSPKVAIITGISPVHTDKEHFGSFEALIREKRKLIEVLPKSGYAILNYDDLNVRKMATHTKAHVLFYGTVPNKCDVWADNVDITLTGVKATLHDGTASFPIETGLIGEHQIYTIMASYLVGKIFDLPKDKFIKKLKKIHPLKGRMSIEGGPLGTTLLNDSLRANPASVEFGLKTLESLKQKGKKFAILAEMGELQEPEKEHAKIGEIIAKLHMDYIITIGPLHKNTVEKAIEKGFSKDHIFWVENVVEAAKIIKPLLKNGDIIYLKGSLYRHVERVMSLIRGNTVNCLCNVTSDPNRKNCKDCRELRAKYPQPMKI
jgi:UDP-N-acetylmuramoyl-tripeptide--D-alanyl-D-alanine ligase